MTVDRLSFQPMKFLKYRIRSAFCRGQGEGEQSYDWPWCPPSVSPPTPTQAKGGANTSHAIVGEPFTKLIDHNEEDAQGVSEATLSKGSSRVNI